MPVHYFEAELQGLEGRQSSLLPIGNTEDARQYLEYAYGTAVVVRLLHRFSSDVQDVLKPLYEAKKYAYFDLQELEVLRQSLTQDARNIVAEKLNQAPLLSNDFFSRRPPSPVQRLIVENGDQVRFSPSQIHRIATYALQIEMQKCYRNMQSFN